MASSRICSVPDCGKPVEGYGYCKNHYYRFHKYGDPLAGGTPQGDPRRFLEQVAYAYQGDDCLIWPYGTDVNGYGQVRISKKTYYVTRLVCENEHGPAPTSSHQAAHSCGRGHEGCCNPKHLRWATVRENHADKRGHGTYSPPPIVNKLTEKDVRDIRALRGKMTQRAIAEIYGVGHSAIGAIQRRKTWRSV